MRRRARWYGSRGASAAHSLLLRRAGAVDASQCVIACCRRTIATLRTTIPVVNYIDDRLYHRRIDGYRFEDMPDDHEAHRLGLQAIEAIAHHLFHRSFVQLEPREQDQVLQTIHDGNPPAGEEIWKKMPVTRYWMLLMQDAIEAYYAHPYAWDEIGFGGPAYHAGYMRLEGGKPEPWEVEEQRYEWKAPPTSLSDVYTPVGGPGGHKQQPSGQEGTH